MGVHPSLPCSYRHLFPLISLENILQTWPSPANHSPTPSLFPFSLPSLSSPSPYPHFLPLTVTSQEVPRTRWNTWPIHFLTLNFTSVDTNLSYFKPHVKMKAYKYEYHEESQLLFLNQEKISGKIIILK